jgi:rfaE bifunctional protein nucleotidyltransferase chain/domain
MRSAIDMDTLLQMRAEWKAAGKVVVCTNGVFDLLHYGHLQYLDAARALGDVLVVGLNSDASTRRYKGPTRPLVPEEERAALLLALEPVDQVVIFDEPTAERLVAELRPEIYCKGGDYAPERAKALPEAAIVQAYGGEVRLIPYLEGHSTSELIRLIRERYVD